MELLRVQGPKRNIKAVGDYLHADEQFRAQYLRLALAIGVARWALLALSSTVSTLPAPVCLLAEIPLAEVVEK
jgi:hypothetical protein